MTQGELKHEFQLTKNAAQTGEAEKSSTPPRSPSREDLASSALLSFHGVLGQPPDLESDDEDNQLHVPGNGFAKREYEKSNNTLTLNLAQDDRIVRNQNIKKMIRTNYFHYEMDGRLRTLLVDQVFHGIGKLVRNQIVRTLLDHMDERTLKKVSKHIFARMQISGLQTGENYRKRDGGYLPPAPRAKRRRLDFENNFRAAQDPSFERPAGRHSRLSAVDSQNSAPSTNFVSLNRPRYPPPSSVNSAIGPAIRKDLGHLVPTNPQLPNNRLAFGHWSEQRSIISRSKPHSTLSLKMKADGRRPHENIPAPYNPRVSAPYATLNPFRKGTRTSIIPAGYNNKLLPRYPPQVAMSNPSKSGFGNNDINYNPRFFSNFNQAGRPIKSYNNKGGRPPSNRFKARQRESAPPQPDMFICPAPNCGKLMRSERVPYTHGNSGKSFCFIYDCCGAEYSTLRCLSSDKCLRFERLDHMTTKPARWYRQGGQWRLKCRGKVWTRCDHCRALFMHHSGKSGHHTKDKCPKFKEDQAKKQDKKQ